MSKYVAEYSAYVGNLDCSVSVSDLEELIYELFLQVSYLNWSEICWIMESSVTCTNPLQSVLPGMHRCTNCHQIYSPRGVSILVATPFTLEGLEKPLPVLKLFCTYAMHAMGSLTV